MDLHSVSSLKLQYVGRHVAPLESTIPILNQLGIALFLNNRYLTEIQQNLILYSWFGFMWPGFEFIIYWTRGEHANHYTTYAILYTMKIYDVGKYIK